MAASAHFRFFLLIAFVGLLFPCLQARAKDQDEQLSVIEKASRYSLVPFESETALTDFVKELAAARAREQERWEKEVKKKYHGHPPIIEADRAMDEGITNVQHAGVDEGDIVKFHGKHLVILSRGRLFTVSLLPFKSISAVDAYGPGIDPKGTWYDEMLISGDTIAVIGYSYQRGGTEIGLFHINDDGQITYRATYQLRSNDYYSSRNYASRLIGTKLIFYTPLFVKVDEKHLFKSFPALRKWHPGVTEEEFRPIVSATEVYRPIVPERNLVLHTVTSCDLSTPELECKATAVFGGYSRNFYVSPNAVYVWLTYDRKVDFPPSLVYRMPLAGGGPTALRVFGGPIDQFSFLEEGNFLNVLVRAYSAGDAMWSPEFSKGNLALLRVPLSQFSTVLPPVTISNFKSIPTPPQDYPLQVQNRFVGDYLIYGNGNPLGAILWQRHEHKLYLFRYAGNTPAEAQDLDYTVDRIEPLGEDALVVGADNKNLSLTTIALREKPRVVSNHLEKNAAQGELRSHGFFYKPLDRNSGILGLPVRQEGRPGFEHLLFGSNSILFLRNKDLQLKKLGSLSAKWIPREGVDQCKASCVDWYGNSRPIFIQNRILALLGYELVEGDLNRGNLLEARRVNLLTPLK